MTNILARPTARVALTAFNRIGDRWALTPSQRAKLLGRSGRTAHRYGGSATRLSEDVLERISLLIGIFEDVRSLFGRGTTADEWVLRRNRDFGDHTPLERMLAGKVSDLVLVRRYLAVARQGIVPEAL